MPLEVVLGGFRERYLWLSNPIIWKDPFEKRFIEAKYQYKGKEYDFPLKGRVFCTCMTQTATSEAHWNNYSRGQIGISLAFKKIQLLDVLEKNANDYDIYVGKVNYLRTREIKNSLKDIGPIKGLTPFSLSNREILIKLLLLKRIAFRYEDEIRILAVKKYKTKEDCIKLNYTIKPSDLIDKITIDPNIEHNTETMLKNLFKNEYGFKRVFKSQIYSLQTDLKIEV